MTEVRIIRRNNSIAEVICDGHTGYGVEGEDIVCAGLSCIVQTALLGLLQIATVNVKFERRDDEGYLKITIPEDITSVEREKCDIILETMLLGISDLYQGFSDFIELEVQ